LSFSETTLLGAIAGFTIFLGLPLGRVRAIDDRGRVALAMFAVGILAFIFVDVLSGAKDIVEGAVRDYSKGHGSLGHAAAMTALLAAGFTVGSAGIAMAERRLRRQAPGPPIAGAESLVATAEAGRTVGDADEARRRALERGFTIAVAIGLHNFAEGLAIGVSARAGAVSLATVLIIGFALHNATEGFGIVGPLGAVRPPWAWLGMVGLIAGGPTFVGAMVGWNVTSQPLELTFYALAGGAILYVIGEVWQGMRRYGHRELGLYMLACGFVVGVVTDLVVAYGGG
jgi:zinc transporter, ZIP family